MEYTVKEEAKINRRPIKYIINENGCHICISHSLTRDGYCQAKRNGKVIRIHRYAYELKNGSIGDLLLRHKCDTPNCINPNHLKIGNHKENMKDMRERNRSAKGSKNGNSKLSDLQIKEIKNDKISKNIELAEKYNVTHQAISLIRKGKVWTHV